MIFSSPEHFELRMSFWDTEMSCHSSEHHLFDCVHFRGRSFDLYETLSECYLQVETGLGWVKN